MKTIFKAASLVAFVAFMTTSCSVERKTRDGKKNVIDVGMNGAEKQNNQAVIATSHYSAAATR